MGLSNRKSIAGNKTSHDTGNEMPEKKLWRAVLAQALEDSFGIHTTSMTELEQLRARQFLLRRTSWFDRVCEYADVDSNLAWRKLNNLNLIQKGIIDAKSKREIQTIELLDAIKQSRKLRGSKHSKSSGVVSGSSHRKTVGRWTTQDKTIVGGSETCQVK